MNQIKFIEEQLQPYRNKLKNHTLYSSLKSIEDIQVFMEQHVFAVWDFMSLLKALQTKLTCTTLPWVPVKNASAARFINEIVLGEESDFNELNESKSHFEMYLDAMNQVGANTISIEHFVSDISKGVSVNEAANKINLNLKTLAFVQFTFDIIATNQAHKIASAFTFGREDVIPDMFFQIINQYKTKDNSYSKLVYYLNRHIELDGDEHGPLSLKMIEKLCGNDFKKWDDVLNIAIEALKHRIALWDNIESIITKSPVLLD